MENWDLALAELKDLQGYPLGPFQNHWKKNTIQVILRRR